MELLHALQWDGKPRLDCWLDTIGCEDEAGVGREWMLSLVARALDPGCKVDTVLVLEGEQGKKKEEQQAAEADAAEAEEGKDGKMSPNQARALLRSLQDEEQHVLNQQNRAVEQPLRDW